MQYGLIGEHLGHSFSQEIHGIIADYDYTLRELAPDALEGFLSRRDFRGVNVTIPYKERVIPLLDAVSETAKKIGAVNTIVNRNGELFGYNTDYAGMTALLRRSGMTLAGRKVLIFGTGGTSKTALAVAESLGAAEIIRVSRSGRDGAVTYEAAARQHSDATILINTTPVGMFPAAGAVPADIAAFPGLEGILDVIYHPLRSRLVLGGLARGIPAVGGLYMLAAQAEYATGLFLDRPPDAEMIEKAYRGVKHRMENIVLVGMPSAGKSTVGRRLASLTSKFFLDTDEEFIAHCGDISAYFAAHGEAEFRRVEREIIGTAAQKSGCVIATGGGAILDPENIWALRQNGVIVFLDRTPEKLIATADRPLSAAPCALMARYRERYALYQGAADLRVCGDGSISETANLILEAVNK